MSELGVKFRTGLSLGPVNLVRLAWYRAGIRLGFNGACRISGIVSAGRMFHAPTCVESVPVQSELLRVPAVGEPPPSWAQSAYSRVSVREPARNWWEIPDFDPVVGDIKGVWIASRFDWVITLAQRTRAGERGALDTLEAWLADWCINNPPGKGPNWKCGQEASIRVMHLAIAATLLGQVDATEPALLDLVERHLSRIEPTMGYAIAQDNNHGTSEAAALFIGGTWLAFNGRGQGQNWARTGRRMLENRTHRLVGHHGTFSQYSVNYHRVMLDTLSLAEIWRRVLHLPSFSPRFLLKAKAASAWLRSMVRPENGDAPNIGANDGALLMPLAGTDYRDFRPSVQLATMLFDGARAYAAPGSWDAPLAWFGLDLQVPAVAPLKEVMTFDDGGFAVMHRNSAMAVVRYPRFQFRPSQADALHLDFWLGSNNLLRDAGTYSYNTDDRWLIYFPGTESHNTVQFDGRDQMPRLGRFLFGDWLETESLVQAAETRDGVLFEAAYRDRKGARHRRRVLLGSGLMRVTDEISGFMKKAVLRWRLAPGPWRLEGSRITDGTHAVTISCSEPPVRMEIVEGWESRYYMEKSAVPVLEVEFDRNTVVVSEVTWPL